jgi:hypothetical protein
MPSPTAQCDGKSAAIWSFDDDMMAEMRGNAQFSFYL